MNYFVYLLGLTTMKKMVDPDMIEKSENTMFELAELIDVNKQIGDTLVITQVKIVLFNHKSC